MSNLTNSLVTAGHKIAIDAITKCAEKYNFDAADAVHWYQSTHMSSTYSAPDQPTDTAVAGKKKSTSTGGGRPKKAKTIELPNSTSESNIFRALAEQASVAASDDEPVAYSPEQAAAPAKKIAAKKTKEPKAPVDKVPVSEDKLQKYRDIAAKVVRDASAAQPAPTETASVEQVSQVNTRYVFEDNRHVIEEVEDVVEVAEPAVEVPPLAPAVEVAAPVVEVAQVVVDKIAPVVELAKPAKKEKATGGGSAGAASTASAPKEFKIRRPSPAGELTTYRISPEFLVYTKDTRELVGKYEGLPEDKDKKGRIIFNTPDADSEELESESEGEEECDL